MGCETLPIEYYESLAEKGSSSLFLLKKSDINKAITEAEQMYNALMGGIK